MNQNAIALFGFINGINISVIIILAVFSLVNFNLKKYYVAKVYFILSITVILFFFSMLYIDSHFSKNPFLQENIFLSAAKLTQNISNLTFIYSYFLLFNVKKLQPNYFKTIYYFFYFGLLNSFLVYLIKSEIISIILFYMSTIISLAIIGLHVHMHLYFSDSCVKIRNTVITAQICLLSLMFFLISSPDGKTSSEFILAIHLFISLLILVMSFIFIFFTDEITDRFQTLMKYQGDNLIFKLQFAVKKNLFHMVYQPQISLPSKELIGFEALARWDDPIKGAISPSLFIPLAEHTNYIDAITIQTAKKSIEQLNALRNQSFSGTMSLNLSIKSLKPSTINFIENQLKSYSIPHDRLIIEITESSLLTKTEATTTALKMLNEKKFNISLDDYGTGYASLNHLSEFSPHELKVDASFVNKIVSNSTQKIIVESTIDMCRALKIQSIAEGVEDKETLALLEKMTCCSAQGYFISRPLQCHDALSWAANHQKKTISKSPKT